MVKQLANADICLALITSIAALGVLIWTLEYLCHVRRFGTQGIYSWTALKTKWNFAIKRNLFSRCLDMLLMFPNLLYVFGLRAIAAFLLIALPWLPWYSHVSMWMVHISIWIIFITNALVVIWAPVRRGSCALTSVIFGALLLHQAAIDSQIAVEACIWFIALQACLSYLCCGLGKLPGADWQKGIAVFSVVDHQLYGEPTLARLLSPHRWLIRALTWSVLVAECAFPLVLVMGYPFCWIFLGWGVTFHLFNAVVAGLNSFFWTFLATYPAIIYCVLRVQGLLYG